MVDPPQTGFTGTVWEAVPPEQLAQDLTTGPGAAPLAEAGLAYAALAAGLGEAATEYRAILSVMGDAWASSGNEDGLNQLAALSDWLDKTSAAAQSNAAIAARQAAAYEVARNTLPHIVEITQAVQAAEDLVRGSLLGAPLAGLLDAAEEQLDGIRQQAARVMQAYEEASEHLARPWQQEHAPEVSDGAAFLAEQPGGGNGGGDGPGPGGGNAPMDGVAGPEQLQHQIQLPDLSQLDLSSLQPPAPTVPVGTESLVMAPLAPAPGTLPVTPAGVTGLTVGPQPMTAAPPVMAPAAAPIAAPPDAMVPRADSADPEDAAEMIRVNAGFATAPAVLGGTGTPHSGGATMPSGGEG
ncbi:PPE domain-containing protein [Nocardia sp. alder85J]|uniref:PPE domain-containing protein n=1 Tax=Nocardia sp. alder85J TaxID=2862949 RepID=UPI001CD7FAD3|nr:PPE domain-containing protein [Nocardia sp. alder85J]MCX4093081.1 PPE domain-containing protein [Nocardia sp. alder85J]